MYTGCTSRAIFNDLKPLIATGGMFYRGFSASATVYPTRRWFCSAGFYAAVTFDMLRDKSKTAAKKYCDGIKCLLGCRPLEGKGDRLRWMRWRDGRKKLCWEAYLQRKKGDIHVMCRRNKTHQIQIHPSRHLISRLTPPASPQGEAMVGLHCVAMLPQPHRR